MKLTTFLRFSLFFSLIITLGISQQSCTRSSRVKVDPAFAEYISAFTGGTISAAGSIRICLSQVVQNISSLNTALVNDLIEFTPSIDGKIYWIDNQTVEFKPDQWLERGQIYKASFNLSKVLQVPSKFNEFEFDFSVLNQQMNAELHSIRPYSITDRGSYQATGQVRLLDVCDVNRLASTVRATVSGQELPVQFAASQTAGVYDFTIDSILRQETAGTLNIEFDGSSVDADFKKSFDQRIPSVDEFTVVLAQVVQQPEQYVRIVFSDPVSTAQKFDGLITLSAMSNWERLRYTAEGNEVLVYPPSRLTGKRTLTVWPGIKSIDDKTINTQQQFELSFEDARPAVKITEESRVILPSTNGLTMPFDAVNLSAVDVRVIQLYESNIPQFLQVNDMDGDNQLKRVGRTVKKATVYLNEDGSRNLAEWNTFFLDLDKIMKVDRGSIYRVEIGFKKSYSLYRCPGEETTSINELEVEEESDDEPSDDQFSYWDYYDDYYGEYWYDDYDWRERENPCSNSYYRNRKVAKNLLSSDLGIIAKKGNDGKVLVSVSDLRSTDPLPEIELDILNYQLQPICSMKTGMDGTATYDGTQKSVPFLIVAKRGTERGYLKMDGSKALSVSKFDVWGKESQNGLKGMIYGERGVWRPGDTLFLSFMLEDQRNALPENHPVIFELMSPKGQLLHKEVKAKGKGNLIAFTCHTDQDSETGNYSANVRVGGATFSKQLKIENIKPNRLKIELNFGKDKLVASDLEDGLAGTLSTRWLHGATAKYLKANVTCILTPAKTEFERFRDYQFDDPARSFYSEEQVLYDSVVDDEGKATIGMEDLSLNGSAPGMVNANFNIKVFEEGGDFSVDRTVIPYAPYPVFVGVKLPKGDKERGMLLTDTTHRISVVTVDHSGKPVSRKGVKWTLHKVEWRWWWEQNSDDLARYQGSQYEVPISQGTIDTDGSGMGTFGIKVKYPNWGRYLIRVEDAEGGHASGETIYIDWPGWAGRAERENPGGASMLMFSTSKEKYAVGESCEITFPSSGMGRALVSVENSTGILESHWIKAGKDNTRFSFTTTEAMAPNAYIHVTLIQPHDQTANDLPIRLYGVVPLMVENPKSRLNPVITMADELAPEKQFEVKVSEKSGRGMSYTLAVVDEGLLDITKFKTPDPWSHFYARQSLGVNTFDMYDQVIGAYGAKVEKLLSIGGSDVLDKKGNKKAQRFKPVVMYLGPFWLEPGATASHKMDMPNYVGSVRVMVVAGHDRSYGNAEKSVPVKKPLMVLATLPRMLAPGEVVKLPVNVFAMDKRIRDVKIDISTNDLLIPETKTADLTFKNPGDEVVNFNLKVAENVGKATVTVKVSSGTLVSTYDIELDVRNPNPYITKVYDGYVDAGQSWETTFDLTGMNGTNEAWVEVSNIPAVDFGKRMQYLITYPHGCTEQVTSAAFPQLYVNEIMDITPEEKEELTRNVTAAIRRLSRLQGANGAVTYWAGESSVNEYVTSYVGHFMLEAKARGYALPDQFESRWLSFQRNAAQNWQPSGYSGYGNSSRYSYQNQAYRLYTLAMAGQPELGAMNRLKEMSGRDEMTSWRLAAAYALAGQNETARNIVSSLNSTITEYGDYWGTYGSSLRDKAIVVEALVLLGDRAAAAPIVKEMSKELSSSYWYNTHSVAYSLMAISKFAGKEGSREMKFSMVFNDGASKSMKSSKTIIRREIPVSKLKGNVLRVQNTGGTPMFVRVVSAGQPLAGEEKPESQKLDISVSYSDLSGNQIDVGKIEQGKDFIARVMVSHSGPRTRFDELALTQVFPGGWEITNTRMELVGDKFQSDQADYQDFRDDRVVTYFDLPYGSSRTYIVKLNASYLGRYYLPAVNCEAMYDNTVYAHTAGQWVEVVPSTGATASK